MDAITVLPPNSLAVVEQPFNVAAWEQEGKAIFEAGRVAEKARRSAEQQLNDIRWKVGDWLLAGEKHLKDAAYELAEKATGRAARTLMDFARVARAFPPESRRRDKLTWSHFKEVTPLSEQDRNRLLTEAQTGKLSIQKLRLEAGRLNPSRRPRRPTSGLRTIKMEYDRSYHKLICGLAAARGLYPPGNMFRRIFRDYFIANRASIEQEIADFEAKDAKYRDEERIARKAGKLAKANEPPKPVDPRRLLAARMGGMFNEIRKEFDGGVSNQVHKIFLRYLLYESGKVFVSDVPIETLTAGVERVEAAGDAKDKVEFLRQAAEAQDMQERAGLENELKRLEDFRVGQRKLQDKKHRDAEKAAAKAEKPTP
jgi:hypothetical protein